MKITFNPVLLRECKMFDDMPPTGDPDCLCSKCLTVIGAAEDDPRWLTHNEDECVGCAVCENETMLWKTIDDKPIGVYRFHLHCLESIMIVKEQNPKSGHLTGHGRPN